MCRYKDTEQSAQKWLHADGQSRCQEHAVGEGQSRQPTMLGKLHIYMQKNEIGSLSHTVRKSQLKIDCGLM